MTELKNKYFTLKISDNCVAESLIYNKTGEECLAQGECIPLFALSEERPYNNEIKLAHPNKFTVFSANRVRYEDGKLIVGFEMLLLEAIIEVLIKDDYISFKLLDFTFPKEAYGNLKMALPPVYSFRLLQLPVKNRARFGEILNAVSDDRLTVNLLGNNPYAIVDSESRKGFRILYADAMRDIKLRGVGVSLIVRETEEFLDSVDRVERDYGLPLGVESRRRPEINRSAFWTMEITPNNADFLIEKAKEGGFSMFLIYFSAIFKNNGEYRNCGEYIYNEHYPNGDSDLVALLEKIKKAGMHPGIHFLHTHIGIDTKYVTPVADHRLNTTRRFTLAKPLSKTDTTVYVEENPNNAVMHPSCRVLAFGGEVIYYDSYTEERPYRFEGCKRGHYNTNIVEHPLGQIGGLLDVSEFCGESIYIDQDTSLQDEIAEKIAHIYNLGFDYIYFDGSEGAKVPFAFNVPMAQYKVYKRTNKAPLYCEGAAKAHFGWHMLSGGNAFDVFPTDVFKECIIKYPFTEAKLTKADFTRVNFGWWNFRPDIQPDHYEFGTSKAFSLDCPVTMQYRLEAAKLTPRAKDILEVVRRWELARQEDILTKEEKLAIQNPDKEFTLLKNGDKYELCEYSLIEGTPKELRAFSFSKNGKNYVVFWHTTGSGKISFNLDKDKVKIMDEYVGNEIIPEIKENRIVVTADDKKYLETTLSAEEVQSAFKSCILE